MSEHTPGPWTVRKSPHTPNTINGAHIVPENGSFVICRMSPKADCPIYEKEANAHLIADAPRLKAFNAELVAALDAMAASKNSGQLRKLAEQWNCLPRVPGPVTYGDLVQAVARAALKAAKEKS